MSKTPGTKSYPAEFRAKAVKLVTEKGFTPQQVAEHLGCSLESVRRCNLYRHRKPKLKDSNAAQPLKKSSMTIKGFTDTEKCTDLSE